MKKVISFSLWGENPKYTIGAIKNADLATIFYSDWMCRFYVAKNVPLRIIQELRARNNTEVFVVNEKPDWTGMFWRFFAVCDSSVDVMISRDTDSRLSEREMLAVKEWENSDRGFHIMRDHPQHGTKILGGMWGIKKGLIQNMAELIRNYRKGDFYQVDQHFLREIIYPLIHDNALVHDPIFDKRPFPSERVGYQFVGQVFDEHDRPVMSHLESLKRFLQYQPPSEPHGNVVHCSLSTPRQIPTRREGHNSMKITAYPLYNQAAALQTASTERAGITEHEAVAADLGLSTANGIGWELRCPYALEATWNGGPAPEDLTIRLDAPDGDAPPFVQSQLGDGLLTFYPGYQVQTEGPTSLWVRGPINRPKDGVAPLEQIVDTSLLPCTITVIWQCARPHQTVRFEAGEPFGVLLPYPQHYLDQFELEVIKSDDTPELFAHQLQQCIQAPAMQEVLRRLQQRGHESGRAGVANFRLFAGKKPSGTEISPEKIERFLSAGYTPIDLPALKRDSLTVITACYNHSEYLEAQFRSLLRQTIPPDEVIFVHDCSPDNTLAVLTALVEEHKNLTRTRFKIIDNEKNIGFTSSLNRGIEAATSDLIMIVDDDDALFNDAVEVMRRLFHHHRDIALFGAHHVAFTDDRRLEVENLIRNACDYQDIPLTLHLPEHARNYRHANDINMTHSGSTFLKAAWASIGKYRIRHERVVAHPDRDFQVRMNLLYPVAVSYEIPFSFYRLNSRRDAGALL